MPACRNFFESMITIWGFSGGYAHNVYASLISKTPAYPPFPLFQHAPTY